MTLPSTIRYFGLIFSVLLLLNPAFIPHYTTNGAPITDIPIKNSIDVDQELIGSLDLVNDIPHYIMSQKNQTGSWAINLLSTDDTVYFGQVGGLAGLGEALLNYASSDYSKINQSSRNLAILLASEIGSYLETQVITNSSGSFWPISLSSNIYDYGYDFGISGIISFMAKLYNQTGTQEFADLAVQGIEAIISRTNHTSGLHWSSSMVDVLQSINWYPNDELVFFTNENYILAHNDTYFTGKALGSLGVTQASYDVISNLDINNASTSAWYALNSSLTWLQNQFVTQDSEISFSISSPSIGIVSTSKANGLSGAITLLLDMHNYMGNTTYLNWATGMINWLNGTDSGSNRLKYSKEINGTLSTIIQLGLSHGVAGNIEVFNKYIKYQDTAQFDNRIIQLISYLNNFGTETTEYYKYPELQQGTTAINTGSLSYALGGGSILPVIDTLVSEYNITSLDNDIEKAKAYMYSKAILDQSYNVLTTIQTEKPELSPFIGMSTSFYMMSVTIGGELNVPTLAYDYGTIGIDQSSLKAIPLQNVGDEPITATWNELSNSIVFDSNNYSVIIQPRSTYNLLVTFRPNTEGEFNAQFSIVGGTGESFDISLTGLAYDLPTLRLIDYPENNSMITNRDDITFSVEAKDTSSISAVTMSINNSTQEMTTTVGSNIFEATWDLSNVNNGTYTIIFTATDGLGNTVVKTLQYTVGIYETPIKERIFSPTTLYVMIGITVVLILAAIIATRKYMS